MEKLEPIAPCKNCKERHATCHSKCDGYKDFVKAHEEWKAKYREWEKEYWGKANPQDACKRKCYY